MPTSHDKFYSSDGKRKILVVDDEAVNREMLSMYLSESYTVLQAADGKQAMEIIRENRDTLSLILLDILMPVMTGIEVLEELKKEPELARIPVIVITSEQSSEVDCLKLGAIDFLPKPYPDIEVIHARIQRTIELFEDRDTIQSTERDPLTGLYNRDFFYYYAEQMDQHHRDMEMDAVVVDVNHFHMINERYGKEYGDEVLRRIAGELRSVVQDAGGIVCRREADTFMVYCPHREDYSEILEKASVALTEEDELNSRVRLRVGVYSNADKAIDIERRLDRADMAAASVQGNYTHPIGYYDNSLHERQIYAEQLIEDFHKALAEHQFFVHYQPKFYIQTKTPILKGAEALVRWRHPTLGMISPGVFIPLFEENGLIQELDRYVWEEAVRQLRDWKDRLDYSVPISVNVSRVDMYDPGLAETFQEMVRKYGLTCSDLTLEITESAYAKDTEQIVGMASKLQNMGFLIEMDDFGTGYSSLNMISTLPIDALKLDMQFVRNAFRDGGDTHLIEIIIQIAKYLSVPVIAEGVENEEQYNALKAIDCDIVQGYFFSKPVPAEEFEAFILQRKEAERLGDATKEPEHAKAYPEVIQSLLRETGTTLNEGEKEEKTEQKEKNGSGEEQKAAETRREEKATTGIQLRTANLFFIILALLAAIALFVTDLAVTNGYRRMKEASDRYIEAQIAATDMESGSDYLTDRVRCFVVTGEVSYLNDFIEEVEVTRRRDHAVEKLEELVEEDSVALSSLSTALTYSNDLVRTEYHAMRLALEIGDYDLSGIPEAITGIALTPAEQGMTERELQAEAERLVFDNDYMHDKDRIRENVGQCTQALIRSSSQELENATARMSALVNFQTVMTIVFLLIVVFIVFIINEMVRKPLTRMVEKMQTQETIELTGVEELKFVTKAYNDVLEENRVAREKLSHAASHDALTGLYNRGAYDLLMRSVDTEHMALVLIDVDYFKSINDTYGHTVGDRVLVRVAEILKNSFRSVDIVCRIGGDEFVVVMTRVDSSMKQLLKNKIDRANYLLSHPRDELPPVTLSVGAAFSDRKNPQGDIFRDADAALYRVKEAGRNGCSIWD